MKNFFKEIYNQYLKTKTVFTDIMFPYGLNILIDWAIYNKIITYLLPLPQLGVFEVLALSLIFRHILGDYSNFFKDVLSTKEKLK